MPLAEKNQITFEKTPDYFRDLEAAKRIYDFNPNIKFLLILRDPVTRCISHFVHNNNNKMNNENMAKFFENQIFDDKGMVKNFTNDKIISPGKYVVSYKKWLKYFPKEQILVLDGENFVNKPFEELKKVETFLNLTPYIQKEHFVFDNEKGLFCMKPKLSSQRISCMGSNKGKLNN